MKKILIMASAFLLLAGFAQSAHAASDVDSKIAETKTNVQRLLEIKDNTSITQQEKDRLELQLKKNIVTNIIDISVSQLSDIRSKLSGIAFPQTDDWKSVQSYLFSGIDSYLSFYQQSKNTVQSGDALTLDQVQEIAKNIEQKKSQEIDTFTEKASNVISAFNIADIVKLADDRLSKVRSDVDKVYAQKLVKTNVLRDSLDKAAQAVQDARDANISSKEIILNVYTDDWRNSSTSSDFAVSLRKDAQQYAFDQMKQSTSTANLVSSPDKIPVTDVLIEEYLQNIIHQSADSIRGAYSIFLQMSLSVNQYLQQ